MDEREKRGLAIATLCKIDHRDGKWFVPSQSGRGRYIVNPDPAKPHCTCPDYAERGLKCKHIFAVEFAIRREKGADGTTTITKTVTVRERITYRQDWPAYNKAQVNEKAKFQILLHELCRGIIEPERARRKGMQPMKLADAVFAVVFKVYSTVSGRRFSTDLAEAHAKGYLSRLPHYNTVFNYLENPALTPILRNLIIQSSLPLKTVEDDFAVDSSGFTTCRFESWYDHKYGVVRRQHTWVKIHIMCGVKTNIVTAIEILDKHAADPKQLPALVRTTAANFKPREISADKVYASLDNYDAIAECGATPFIAFKSIHTGAGGGLWEKMFHYFNFNRDDFLKHYHKRSNIESTFNMIKAKFGDHVRSKTEVAQVNEALCKILCHNICCLIQAMYELGINPVFWGDEPAGEPAEVPTEVDEMIELFEWV